MPSNQLFPKEIITDSSEANFSKHSVNTKLIYITVVLFTVAALVSLPFIETDISVRSRGIIQPIIERNQLTSLVSGKISKLYISENGSVEHGQKVVEIAAPLLQERLLFNNRRQREIQQYLNDLSLLQNISSSSVFEAIHLKTVKYRRSILQFKQQVRSIVQEINKAERKFDRDKQLYERKVLSKVTYEQSIFTLQSVRNDLQLLFGQQHNKWQTEKITYQDELDQLQTEAKQLNKEKQQYIITAPVSGTIQNMKGIYEGSFVYPNQTLAEISPDTGLIAECYIPPRDIGLIREGMKVRLQVTAFDYNQWGIVTGTVKEIYNDVTVLNNQPVFTVRSTLDQRYLELENGYRGKLKKGMTVQARFTVARRSLFQLLFDNVDDWLNPKWDEQSQAVQQASM